MDKINITKRMLRNGMQGRIKVNEICRYNKLIDEKNKEKVLNKKVFAINSFEDLKNEEGIKLKKVRSYGGFW